MSSNTNKTSTLEDSFASAFIVEPQQFHGTCTVETESVSKAEMNKTRSENELSSSSNFYLSLNSDDSNLTSSVPVKMSETRQFFPFLSLPDVVVEMILLYLSYDQVAQMRVTSKGVDWVCQRHLNRGFRAVEKFHARCLKTVRSKLPRRESSRREHPYSRHCDILTAIGTRISLLAMTFCKFIDVELCCFIPGKVIDEIFRVLRTCNEKNPPRAFEVLQELRDISSMAMEHFDEKIVPTFKVSPHSPAAAAAAVVNTCGLGATSPSRILSGSYTNYLGLSGVSSPDFATAHSTPKSISQKVAISFHKTSKRANNVDSRLVMGASPVGNYLLEKINSNNRALNKVLKRQRQRISKIEKEMTSQREKIGSLEKLVASQETIIVNQTEKLKEHDTLFAEISKLPKDQGKLNLLACDDERAVLKRTTKCYDKSKSEANTTYMPQLIIQPPNNKRLAGGKLKNTDQDLVKMHNKCSKRKTQNQTDDRSSASCKRIRCEDDDINLSVIKCGALASAANKKK